MGFGRATYYRPLTDWGRPEATVKSREETAAITNLLAPFLPESKRKESLSWKALLVLASTPGVTCVLNGMRTSAYVNDSLGIPRWEPLPGVRRIYEAIKTARVSLSTPLFPETSLKRIVFTLRTAHQSLPIRNTGLTEMTCTARRMADVSVSLL